MYSSVLSGLRLRLRPQQYITHYLHTCAQAFYHMLALSQTIVLEALRSVSTAFSLWAARQQCAPCSPVLHCAEAVRCPDCVCQGTERSCPAQESCSWSFSGFFVGVAVGIALTLGFTLFCSVTRRRRLPPQRLPAPAAEIEDDLAAAAQEQIRQVRSRHGA